MIVSLPKDWVSKNELAKGDIVSIEELSSGDLRISQLQGEKSKTCTTIDCTKLDFGLLDLLIGAYLSGTDVIKVVSSERFQGHPEWSSVNSSVILEEWKLNQMKIKKLESYLCSILRIEASGIH